MHSHLTAPTQFLRAKRPVDPRNDRARGVKP
jgi:hypothetical protein